MSKKNLILGGILILMVFLAFLLEGPIKKFKENLLKEKSILSGLVVDELDEIEIVKGGEMVTLERTSKEEGDDFGKWRIKETKDFYVKDEIMRGVIESLREAVSASTEVVSENEDNKADFQTGAETGIGVKLSSESQEKMRFVIGKVNSESTGTYISKNDISKTYVVDTLVLSSVFSRDDWYNKTVFSTDGEKITMVRFQYPKREMTVKKNDDGWIGIKPYSFRVDDEKIEKMVGIMTNLVASEIPEQKFEGTGLESHDIIVQATGDGIDNTIMIGSAKEGDENLYYAKRADSDNIYLITKEERDELEKKIWQLR